MKMISQTRRRKILTFCPFDNSTGPKSEPIVTSAPEITPVSYPVSRSNIIGELFVSITHQKVIQR